MYGSKLMKYKIPKKQPRLEFPAKLFDCKPTKISQPPRPNFQDNFSWRNDNLTTTEHKPQPPFPFPYAERWLKSHPFGG